MQISNYFNETELAIFCRQAGFAFNGSERCLNGIICAVDAVSGQLFIGKDLLRSNVRSLSSITDINVEESGNLHISFKDESGMLKHDFITESDSNMAEVYSRLVNSGRDSAISYLVFDAEYRKIKVDLWESKYYTLNVSAESFSSLTEKVIDELYDYLYLCYDTTGGYYPSDCPTEGSVRIKRVKVLKRLSGVL